MESKRSIVTDSFYRMVLSEDQAIDLLLSDRDITHCIMKDDVLCQIEKNKFILDVDSVFDPQYYIDSNNYHSYMSERWNIPEKYFDIDMKTYLLSLCDQQKEIDRVNMEYAMYEERGMVKILQFLVFLVEYLRENCYIWGVGRGSSVASYCLFLIGVHKIDSIKYDLDIKEFLK